MKRQLRVLLAFLLLLSILTSLLCPSVFAAEEDGILVSHTVVYHEDGSREEIDVTVFPSSRSVHQITGSKIKRQYSSSNELIWKVTLTGVFQYNNTTSVCTDASTTVTFYQSGWVVLSENTTHSSNTASTVVTLGKYINGALVTAGYANLTLSCDKDGNLS